MGFLEENDRIKGFVRSIRQKQRRGTQGQDPGEKIHRCAKPLLETELRFCIKKCPQLDGETDGARSPVEAKAEA